MGELIEKLVPMTPSDLIEKRNAKANGVNFSFVGIDETRFYVPTPSELIKPHDERLQNMRFPIEQIQSSLARLASSGIQLEAGEQLATSAKGHVQFANEYTIFAHGVCKEHTWQKDRVTVTIKQGAFAEGDELTDFVEFLGVRLRCINFGALCRIKHARNDLLARSDLERLIEYEATRIEMEEDNA